MKRIIKNIVFSLLLTFPICSQWTQQNSGTSQRLLTCFFLNSNVGWIAGYNGTILKTDDGGINWVPKSIATPDDIHSIYFLDTLNGWATFYEYDPMRHGSIIHTTDGGNNWSVQYVIYDAVLHDVFFTDLNNGYFVGSSGVLYRTTNGGQFWYNISPITDYWFYSTYFFNQDVGWVCGGLEGDLLRTSNGGQTWSFISIPTTERMMCLYFMNDNYGWACGAGGKIISTTNAGLDWLLGSSGVSEELRDIQFVDQNEGWSVGLNGKIIHSMDSGSNWSQQSSGTNNNLYGVHFADNLTGWAVGDQGIILKTVNGGVPVELVSFSGVIEGVKVILSWKTATEINNSGFEVERKLEDTEFMKLGFVPGFGTTTEPKNYSFNDENVHSGIYIYRLKQIDHDGTYEYSDNIIVEVTTPAFFALEQNYPNPFNPTTTITYSLASDGFVTLEVYDVLGNEVASLVNGQQKAGDYDIVFDGSNFSSGVYYYKLSSGEFTSVKKLVLMK